MINMNFGKLPLRVEGMSYEDVKPFCSGSLETLPKHSLIPSFLYSSSSSPRSALLVQVLNSNSNAAVASRNVEKSPPALTTVLSRTNFLISSPTEPGKGLATFYAACTFSGVLCCGLTHMAVTPLDVVKCNMQIDPVKFHSISSGFQILLKEQGIKGFYRGWVPTLLGYSFHGACKFGFYDFFKKYYSELAGLEQAARYKTIICFAGSASAEVVAAAVLCPFEAVKVYVQTQSPFTMRMLGFTRFVVSGGGFGSLYKGFAPLLGRQLPYTMMKFVSCETIVEMIYLYPLSKEKHECSKVQQLGVGFVGGYVTGALCALVSNPADNLVSFVNHSRGRTIAETVKKIGLVGLFKRGLLARILMIGSLTGAQWGIYDAIRSI